MLEIRQAIRPPLPALGTGSCKGRGGIPFGQQRGALFVTEGDIIKFHLADHRVQVGRTFCICSSGTSSRISNTRSAAAMADWAGFVQANLTPGAYQCRMVTGLKER